MMSFRTLNTLTGWAVFAVAATVYTLTLEPTASFWDSGEFIASAYKLQVPHPPGAPLYLLIGRLFSLFALGDGAQVAWWVNLLSGLASAFTVLFLFWTTTLLARKLLQPAEQEEPPVGQTILVLGSGAVGALAFTFTDSFWFSAVEAEVYALSAFFTAIVVWAMLRWEAEAGRVRADKWLLLIAYLVGLSIGVHLLNLLAIPALAFIFYFRQYRPSRPGVIGTFLVSAGIIGVILWGVIPGLPSLAGGLELFFVNSLGLPFGSGVGAFGLLLAGALVYGIRYALRHQKRLLHTGLLAFIYVLIGYSSYLIIPIRSAYNPPIDENNPDNVLSFVSYLKREQYGDRPLLYGPQFNVRLIDQKEGSPRYVRTNGRYEISSRRLEPVYDPQDMALLPRLYSDQPQHLREYQKWVDVRENQMPTFGQNLAFLWHYQLGHMYGRYFLWNFVGRESDLQHAGVLWPGAAEADLPERVRESRARNAFYALPLLLGLLGAWFHFRRRKQDAWTVGLLFFCTGVAIALYLNQPPVEPRERDYTFVGSFYAFSVWIGLGVPALADLLRRVGQAPVARAAVAIGLGGMVPLVLALEGWDDHDRTGRYIALTTAKNLLASCAPNAILFTNGDNDTFPLWYAQEVEGFRTDVRVAVLTYLNTDWYVEQMMRPAYDSAPWPLSLGMEGYRQGTNDYLPLVEKPQVKSGIDVRQYLELVKQNHPALQVTAGTGRTYTSLPTRNLFLEVDPRKVREKGLVANEREGEEVTRMEWKISGSGLEKKHLVLLDLLVTNNWERPVYFSSGVARADFLNLEPYFQTEGLAYRVLPLKNPEKDETGRVATDILYENLMHRFTFHGLDNPRVFYDENALRFPSMTREKFADLATALLAQGDTLRAREVLARVEEKIPHPVIPPDFNSAQLIVPLAQVGETEKAMGLLEELSARAERDLAWYAGRGNRFDTEIQINLFTLQRLYFAALELGLQEKAVAYERTLRRYFNPG
jgi:hypothetical protein